MIWTRYVSGGRTSGSPAGATSVALKGPFREAMASAPGFGDGDGGGACWRGVEGDAGGERGPGERERLRQAEAVLRQEGRPLGGVQQAVAAADAADHRPAEADVRLQCAGAVVGEQHGVGVLL